MERERASGSARDGREAGKERNRDMERDYRNGERKDFYRDRDRGGDRERHKERDGRSHLKEDDYRSSRRHSRSRSRSPDRKKHHRLHNAESEASTSAGESEDESEEARRARKRRERKRREEEREDSDYERRKRRKERERRDETSQERSNRRRKKKEKKRLSRRGHKSGAIMDYGKYGVINEIDVNSRLTSEFRQWLVEERHINPETISRAIEKKEMATFIEDYNTATMSSDKYYNLEAHEKRMAMIRAGETVEDESGGYDPLADELAAKAAFKAQRRMDESTRSTPSQWQTKEQLEALHRVQTERIEAAKMKQLGLQTSATKGVRMDGTEFDRR